MNILLCIVASILAAAVTARISAKFYLKRIDVYFHEWIKGIEAAVDDGLMNPRGR